MIGAVIYAVMWYRKQRREQEQQVQGPYVNVGSAAAAAPNQVYVPMESIPPSPSNAAAAAASGGYQLGGVVVPPPVLHPTIVASPPHFAPVQQTDMDQMGE